MIFPSTGMSSFEYTKNTNDWMVLCFDSKGAYKIIIDSWFTSETSSRCLYTTGCPYALIFLS